MRKKVLILISAGVAIFILGVLITSIVVPFFNEINRMSANHFVRTFGPDGLEADRHYDDLYEVAHIYVFALGRRQNAFFLSVGLAFLITGVILFLWGRDLKRYR